MICPGEPVLCLSLSLKAWGPDESVVRSLSPRAGEAGVPAQQSGREANSPFPCPALSRPTVDWVMPTDVGEGHLLYSAH